MPEQLSLQNFADNNIIEKGSVEIDSLAGQDLLNLYNSQGWIANSYILAGTLGAETSELHQIETVPTNKQLKLIADLAFEKSKDEPVYRLFGNQIRIYRAANPSDNSTPADGAFSLQATVTIDADQLETLWTDPTGGKNFWYKQTYYNEFSGAETPLDDAVAVRGGGVGLYVTVGEVRQEAQLQNNPFVEDSQVLQSILDAQDEVNASLLIGGYAAPLETPSYNVRNATKLLAAGYILTSDPRPEFQGIVDMGEKKIKMARDILTKIETAAVAVVTGEDNQSTNLVDGWPNDQTSDPYSTEANGDDGPAFTKDMVF